MQPILTPSFGDGDTVQFEIRNGSVVPSITMNPKPTPKGVGFVDQLSFTFTDDFHKNDELRKKALQCGAARSFWIDHREVIKEGVGALLRDVFGIAIGAERATGLNFYQQTWKLRDDAGMVSIGGQGNTILVQITGAGMARTRDGWQSRLWNWVQVMHRFVITRLDVAYDDHESAKYSVDKAAADYDQGKFSMGGRPPSCEQRGNWRRIDGKGRSFYVGKRQNGKMLRVYEKGRQLGDPASEWVRVELELHNEGRVIPFDAILNPGAYLAGSYSATAFVVEGEQHSRIKTISKVAKMTYDALLKHFARSYGGLVKVILSVEEQALDRLADLSLNRPMPKRLDLALSALDQV